LTKFFGGVGHGTGTNEFDFGDDPHHCPDPDPETADAHVDLKLELWSGIREPRTPVGLGYAGFRMEISLREIQTL